MLAVVWSMQNVSAAPFDVNVQHLLFVGSVQSAGTWQSWTFVVSVQFVARWVGHAAALEHDVPTDVTPQVGNDPVPFGTSVPQQIGVAPLQSFGPSQLS